MFKRFLLSLLCLASSVAATAAASSEDFQLCWGDTDLHYSKTVKPSGVSRAFDYSAWRGEKVNAEFLIWAPADVKDVRVSVSDLVCGKNTISSDCVDSYFIRYVTGEVLAEQFGQCGARNTTDWASVQQADMLDNSLSTDIAAGECQPVWLSVRVPDSALSGKYRATVTVSSDKCTKALTFELQVVDRLMKKPHDWSFYLDLWQNPYSVARYHNVPLWSEEHFALMRPLMQMLADAGQKVITTTILDRPWNGQTEDAFGTMVTKIRRVDGTWLYDYTIFDMWVEFMMSIGIDKQINCYSLIPWKLQFDYYDQATGKNAIIQGEPQSKEYQLYWAHFIKDFANHLREKGWFDITMIAMDERPMESMRSALDLIHGVEPDLKVSLAGRFIEEIEPELDFLAVTFREEFPASIRERRAKEGKISTFYTCCAEKYPNTFIASEPSEAQWMGWYAFATGLEGYLRWAYNSWTIDPVNDARFRNWAAGDTYIVYPDARSSVRFEKMIEGIRDFEKATELRAEWESRGRVSVLKKFDKAVSAFTFQEITDHGAAPAVKQVRRIMSSAE